MNIETLDFEDLMNEQQSNPQQVEMKEKELIQEQEEKLKKYEKLSEELPEIEEKQEKKVPLLPLGTVVMLKGGKKRLMIIGFYPLNEEKTGKAYDYIGCLFPEGLLVADKLAMFNHNQIEKVHHEGLLDAEEEEFKEKLEDFFDSLN